MIVSLMLSSAAGRAGAGGQWRSIYLPVIAGSNETIPPSPTDINLFRTLRSARLAQWHDLARTGAPALERHDWALALARRALTDLALAFYAAGDQQPGRW
jgi:hypothetical protein